MLETTRRRSLGPTDSAIDRPNGSDGIPPPDVAANLRRARQLQGLSLETLAKRSGVSRAMLGQIETGKSVPTITVIWKVANALCVPAASLIASETQTQLVVVRAGELQSIMSSGGMFSKRLLGSAAAFQPFELSEITIGPRHRETLAALPHLGRATLVVVSGSVEVGAGDDRSSRLGAGDAVHFQADVSHWLFNDDAHPATAYLIVTGGRNGR